MKRDRREALKVLYGFFREIDDIADEPGGTEEAKRLLSGWKEAVNGKVGEGDRTPLSGRWWKELASGGRARC